MKLYLDTNVLLDFLLDSRRAFHGPAVELMRRIALGDVSAGFSTSQATDLYYHLRKAAGDKIARTSLQGLFSLCELYITPPSSCIDALFSDMSDYEDAVQVETARTNRCDMIVTRDAKDFSEATIAFIEPKGILAMLDEGLSSRPTDDSPTAMM